MEQEGNRAFTDEDITALVNEFRKQIMQQFFSDLGKGLFGLFRASFLVVVLAVLGYGTWLQAKGN